MRKGYIFTDKRTSHRAVMGVILGLISLVSLGGAVFQTYLSEGESVVKYGVVGLLSGIYSLIGLILGVVTVYDKNYYKFFPVAGIVLNLAILGSLGLIVYMGVS